MTREHWEIYAILRKIDRTQADAYKRKIRVKHCRTISPDDAWTTAFYDEDSITKKQFFPYHFTDEEWQDFCNDTVIQIYSSYDCTGRLFTVALDQYRVSGGTWVYHRMALDV